MDNITLLNRISFGYTSKSLAALEKMGYTSFIDQQLNAPLEDKSITEKLESFVFVQDRNKKGERLKYTNATLEDLWKLQKNKAEHHEKMRPHREIILKTWFSALHSEWQLKELIVDFWFNHFNVSVQSDARISITLPLYDKVIRQHCFGNFRVFLEEVAKSPAMLYYLDNAESKASPANENYARELFELHTLGAKYYFNNLYNRWREVPGAEEGNPVGYIDEDVYEAARAFTGWTVADGRHDQKGGHLPNTGEFMYFEGWHDNYQKRVLGVEFDSNQAPMEDAQKVLDLVAFHSATAEHLCTKLCRRLVGDNPPQKLIDEAITVWKKNKDANDQIKQVIRSILLSEAFKNSLGKRIKRPPELVFSFIRALELELEPKGDLFWMFDRLGYKFFSWATPTGHPDDSNYWTSSNMLMNRWNIFPMLLADWHGMLPMDALTLTPKELVNSEDIVEYWAKKLFGKLPDRETIERLTQFLASGGVGDEPLAGNERDKAYQIHQTILLMAMSPDFQYS